MQIYSYENALRKKATILLLVKQFVEYIKNFVLQMNSNQCRMDLFTFKKEDNKKMNIWTVQRTNGMLSLSSTSFLSLSLSTSVLVSILFLAFLWKFLNALYVECYVAANEVVVFQQNMIKYKHFMMIRAACMWNERIGYGRARTHHIARQNLNWAIAIIFYFHKWLNILRYCCSCGAIQAHTQT